uniref:Ubiquitin thioesterase OTUB1 n=2 Tax=Sarcophilus harrisii TaxID=9305 RepID=A0A7N4V3Z1_SARHA
MGGTVTFLGSVPPLPPVKEGSVTLSWILHFLKGTNEGGVGLSQLDRSLSLSQCSRSGPQFPHLYALEAPPNSRSLGSRYLLIPSFLLTGRPKGEGGAGAGPPVARGVAMELVVWRRRGGCSLPGGEALITRKWSWVRRCLKMAAEEPQQQKPEPLGSDSEGVNCLAYDEAIMAQQDRIQQEIAVQNPLVSERLELSVLYKEYAEDDNIYQQKIKDLHKKYSYIRKTRPDGNCFYRAFGFSHLEALLEDSKELQRFKAISAKSKEDLVSQGFTEFTIEDFHNTFMDLIEQVEKRTSVADLLASFNDQSTSDYLVVYLRLLTSGYLQRESKFFEHFIEGGRTVKEFCQQEVEPMCKESDHIHIIALAQALSVSIQVEYMDRGEGGTTNPHVFPEGSEPKVYLLYRPGHYDILYK